MTQEHSETKKEGFGELGKTILIAVMLAALIRSFLFEPFNIPSGSMIPNLLVGDYLFVSKSSYGYSKHSFPLSMGGFDGRIMAKKPVRGDVAVFKLPTDTSIDYIKRVVAMPGETVQMINGRLYINDKRVEREAVGRGSYDTGYGKKIPVTIYKETLPNNVVHTIYEESDNAPLDNTEKFRVPDGYYFMMGDNRDNSRDSRDTGLVGLVPFDNFVGRADLIFFSTNGEASLAEIWKWPSAIRFKRILSRIGNGTTLQQR